MKKYVLFIVEGSNDKREIQAIIRAATGNKFTELYVDSYYTQKGDLTSERGTNEKNIINRLNEIVIDWRNGGEYPYQKILTSDVERIIHVVDTDGVFIPESAIIQTDDGKTQYHDNKICCFKRNDIVSRNRKKARVLRRLINTKTIDNIKYNVVFVSCNMDHVLFDTRNPFRSDKDINSLLFACKCNSKADLESTIYCPGIRSDDSFYESWNRIQQEYNSLHRHTNINLFLDEFNISS